MLTLSKLLIAEGVQLNTFEELTSLIQRRAEETKAVFFQIDIEPPHYVDRPPDWYDQLELAFSTARLRT